MLENVRNSTTSHHTFGGADAVKVCLTDFPFGSSAVEDSEWGRLLGLIVLVLVAMGICQIPPFNEIQRSNLKRTQLTGTPWVL